MRPVVLDTSVILPALISPRGYRRRFWVLLAFGALAARRDLARLEADALRAEADALGGTVGGAPIEQLAEQAEAGYARLAEALPHGTPDDWRLVCSRSLLGEYERKLRETGPKLDPTLHEQDIQMLRRQIEIVCTDITDDFDPTQIPTYTSDRDDDPVVHTALLADAVWLISDDRKHIATTPDGATEYELPESDRRVSAITFSRFVEHVIEIDLGEIDPALIALAFRPINAG